MFRTATWRHNRTGKLHVFELKNPKYHDGYELYRRIFPAESTFRVRVRNTPTARRVDTRPIRGDHDAYQFWNLLCRQMNNRRDFSRLDR